MKKPKPKLSKASHAIACPRCGGAAKLVYTRGNTTATFRRRECLGECGRFTTVERLAGAKPDPELHRRNTAALSVLDLLDSLRTAVADLQGSITIPSTGDAK